MFRDTELLAFRYIHPFSLVLKDLADGTPLDAKLCSDVLLPCIRVLLMIYTDGLAVNIIESLFAMLHSGRKSPRVKGRQWIR